MIVKERFDDLIFINYSKKEIVESVSEIKHDLVRESMKIAGVTHGVEITTLADVPSSGSGLGSSSSVTVGLLNALHAYRGEQVTAETLAQQACDIEIKIMDKPIGKQDQYIAAYGGIKNFIFHKDERVTSNSVRLESEMYRGFGANLMLFFTGITRNADKILSEQTKSTPNKINELQKIKTHAGLIKQALTIGQIDNVGEILHETWQEKKKLVSTISNTIVDEMYENARGAGAVGGKLCGAGAGGFLMLYVPMAFQNAVREVLSGYRELPFTLERYGSKIIFNYRSYPWK